MVWRTNGIFVAVMIPTLPLIRSFLHRMGRDKIGSHACHAEQSYSNGVPGRKTGYEVGDKLSW